MQKHGELPLNFLSMKVNMAYCDLIDAQWAVTPTELLTKKQLDLYKKATDLHQKLNLLKSKANLPGIYLSP